MASRELLLTAAGVRGSPQLISGKTDDVTRTHRLVGTKTRFVDERVQMFGQMISCFHNGIMSFISSPVNSTRRSE